MSTVLVTDAGRGSAVAFIRSLARAGHRVVAGDDHRVSAGRWSRSSSASFVYPDPYTDPDGAADALLGQVVEHGVDILIPITDATTRVAESLRPRLPDGVVIAAAPPAAVAAAADKQGTVELAASLGVPVPSTRLVASPHEAAGAGAELGWPVVVKPMRSLAAASDGTMSKFEVGYAFDEDDLLQKVDALGQGSPVLLQEFCGGAGVGLEVLVDHGRVVRSFAHRRIHEVPVTGGASATRTSIPVDPELLGHTERLMSALDWTGLAMVEFKEGASGSRLMEINGRPWGSLPLAVLSGVDFPADWVRMLTHGAAALPADNGDHTVGTVARSLQLETVWIASVLRGPRRVSEVHPWPTRRAAIVAGLRLFDPRVRDDIVSLRDPLASIAEVVAAIRRVARKASVPGSTKGR